MYLSRGGSWLRQQLPQLLTHDFGNWHLPRLNLTQNFPCAFGHHLELQVQVHMVQPKHHLWSWWVLLQPLPHMSLATAVVEHVRSVAKLLLTDLRLGVNMDLGLLQSWVCVCAGGATADQWAGGLGLWPGSAATQHFAASCSNEGAWNQYKILSSFDRFDRFEQNSKNTQSILPQCMPTQASSSLHGYLTSVTVAEGAWHPLVALHFWIHLNL